MNAVDAVRPARRAPWTDVRFLLGILLIVASVAGVWFVVNAARQTAPVFAAADTIVVGQAITDADLRVVDVALGQSGAAYLDAQSLSSGSVATRTIEAGELVPRSAVGDAALTTIAS